MACFIAAPGTQAGKRAALDAAPHPLVLE